MPIYHSTFNPAAGSTAPQQVCGAVVLPLRTKVRGPAPTTTDKDIIDESIEYFRANVLHRNFKILGPADLIVCYLTAFITEVLRELVKYPKKEQARAALVPLAVSTQFAMPGSPGFAFPGFFKQPESPQAAELFRSYFRQLREETINRLVDLVYGADGAELPTPSKWWLMFSRRKFMNIQKVT